MRWQLQPQNETLVREITAATGVSEITAQLLINRNITNPDDVERFLRPSIQHLHNPYLLTDMNLGVDRILKAISGKEQITVYGDYDADGVSSTALLLKFLHKIDVEADYYIPHRIQEGYGLNKKGMDVLRGRGTRLIITVDNGVNAYEQVEYAKTLGMDVVVTDHHEAPKKLPRACAVIDPKRHDCKFPFKDLAGVGVVFNLIMALRQRLREIGYFNSVEEPRLRELLDIVAIGTVADVVPLLDENRLFVKFGLDELKKSTNHGVTALKIISGLESHQINATTIAFRLAPRINAAGRIDDQNLGVELLTTTNPEEATKIAEQLHSVNSKRQSIEEVILKETGELVKQDPLFDSTLGLVLAKDGWHQGVLGIVANRLADEHMRPTIVIGIENGVGRGSGRSVGNYNLIAALDGCSDLLENFGGHKHAAGVTIMPENISAFKERFNKIVCETIMEEDRADNVMVDAEIDSSIVTEKLIEELELLEPFGEGNPEPTFCIRELKVAGARVVKERHLKLTFTENLITLDAIGFGMAHHDVGTDDILDVAFIPQRDLFKGNGAVQLKLKDLKQL